MAIFDEPGPKPEPKPLHPYGANLHTTHSGYSWLPGHPPQAVPCAAEPNVAARQSEEPGAYDYRQTARVLATDLSDIDPSLSREAALAAMNSIAERFMHPDVDGAIESEFERLLGLFRDRQRKYGPGNIARFGDYGVLVRCADKLARLERHYTQGVGDMPDESVEDAWSDLAVYATIALVCRRGQWPGWTPK